MAEDRNRGIAYLVIGWVLTPICIVVVLMRVYSRTFLTRSIGADDFSILIALALTCIGMGGDTWNVVNGLGRHEQFLNSYQLGQIDKWEAIVWIIAFISFFFIRTSIMLFVLRLLPQDKKIQEMFIYVAFAFNFAITMIACVSFGVQCIPFPAIYREVEGSTCVSQDVLVATQYVNAILACLIDITTALVPQFLLWNVRMNRRTKISLDIIFALGLITAGLSIGRAATSNAGIWETDTSWRIIPSNTFTLVEDKCGIIFASCPALRQFFAYRRRLGTSLPSTQHRQPPNADFESMRMRINVRDIFWYRKPLASEPGKPIRDPRPIFQKRSQAEVDAERSALDNAENKFMDNMENISRPTHPGSSNTLTGWLRDKGDLLKTPASRRGKNVAMERLPSSSEHLSRPSDPFQRPSPYVVDRRNQGT